MGFSIVLLLIIIALIAIYSYVFLGLNKSTVHLDLLFIELDIHLGWIILISFSIGILVSVVLEIIFFSSKKRAKDE